VKDLFEHHLGHEQRNDGKTLKLARGLTAGLGILSTAIAILWPDIIGLLLFTYHIWAPAIILPIVVGSVSKEYSPQLGQQIFVTMIVAVVVTMLYRTTDLTDTFDPAVVGVFISLATFLLLRVGYRILGKHATQEEIQRHTPDDA
jgi:xanthine/uracil permease